MVDLYKYGTKTKEIELVMLKNVKQNCGHQEE